MADRRQTRDQPTLQWLPQPYLLLHHPCLSRLPPIPQVGYYDSDTVDYAINEIDVPMIVIKAQHKD